MGELIRLLLLVGIAAAGITLAASAAVWWQDETRRLTRLIRKVLGVEPDASIIARGRNAAAAISLDTQKALILWNGGARAIAYPLAKLEGAELIIDDEVAARVYRGEPRRPLDRVHGEARRVTLRLVFDDPRDPDFDLDLWLPNDRAQRESHSPSSVIQEARSWLARAEAIIRMPAQAPAVHAKPIEEEPPWDETGPP